MSDDQTNIGKSRLAANITEYHIISKLIFLRIIIPKCPFVGNSIFFCRNNALFLYMDDIFTTH